MGWKRLLREYFTFTRKERIGLIVVLILILCIWFSPRLISSGKLAAVPADMTWMVAAKKLQHLQERTQDSSEQNDKNINDLVYDKSVDNYLSNSGIKLSYFDPNTLSLEGWKKLGIQQKTINTIQKYLNKGGYFYKNEDLKKIYGLHREEYARLEPYIKIAGKEELKQNYSKYESKKEQSNTASKYHLIDINLADTSEFIALPGIGSKLASRIVNFRDKLGGFYSIEQLGETYGLPDSTFQKIKPFLTIETTSLKRININTATKDEMKLHPYIKWNLANSIVEYRNQHGNYASLEDIKKISLITDDIFNKIKFYLAL